MKSFCLLVAISWAVRYEERIVGKAPDLEPKVDEIIFNANEGRNDDWGTMKSKLSALSAPTAKKMLSGSDDVKQLLLDGVNEGRGKGQGYADVTSSTDAEGAITLTFRPDYIHKKALGDENGLSDALLKIEEMEGAEANPQQIQEINFDLVRGDDESGSMVIKVSDLSTDVAQKVLARGWEVSTELLKGVNDNRGQGQQFLEVTARKGENEGDVDLLFKPDKVTLIGILMKAIRNIEALSGAPDRKTEAKAGADDDSAGLKLPMKAIKASLAAQDAAKAATKQSSSGQALGTKHVPRGGHLEARKLSAQAPAEAKIEAKEGHVPPREISGSAMGIEAVAEPKMQAPSEATEEEEEPATQADTKNDSFSVRPSQLPSAVAFVVSVAGVLVQALLM